MACNCIGGNPCPCQRSGLQMWPQWPQGPWYYPQPSRFGWVCPRCSQVKSPDVQQCHCQTQFTLGPGSGLTAPDAAEGSRDK
jgi:hypothetical protein